MASEATVTIKGSEHRIKMGLGEAIQRLIHVETAYSNNLDVGADLRAEATLIVAAMDQQFQLDLGFDCNSDGVPDSIEIFKETAATSCCRILPLAAPKRRRRASRAKR